MHRRLWIPVSIALAVGCLAVPAALADVSPGKNSAFASIVEQTPLPGYGGALVSASLQKGRSKRVLSIHGTLSVRGAGAAVIGILPRVNGVSAEPARITTDCASHAECSVTGSWYFDVDAAETANPEMFVGEPLLVELIGGDTTPAEAMVTWDASVSVVVVKK
jgi:hypothetical protein